MTMPAESLYAALLEPQAPALRLQTLVNAIRGEHRCGAVGLLKHDGDQLRPLAVSGLMILPCLRSRSRYNLGLWALWLIV